MGRLENWGKRIKFYGENTSIHGISYVLNSHYFLLERLCWLIVVIVSMYGMLLIFLASYDAYDTNPISFVTETTYLSWNTTFPAVSICQVMNQDIYWTAQPNAPYSALQTFISEVVFFTGSCYACSKQCEECEKVNMLEVVKRYRKPCSSVLGECKWNNEPFNCCDKFLPINTEYGVCFAINSLHSQETKKSSIGMMSNRFTGPGELSIQSLDDVRSFRGPCRRAASGVVKLVNLCTPKCADCLVYADVLTDNVASQVFFHAPEDIPFINADPDKRDDVMLGERYIKYFNVIEISNDEEVRQLPVQKRGCRFPDEPPPELKVHKLYSYSTCIVQCHADAQMRFCNCTHHLIPNSPPKHHCNIQGLKCLTENYEILNRLHSKGFDKPGLECDCDPSCIEPEYKVVMKQNGVSGLKSEIVMKLQSLPTQRFKRNVVRSTLDLVVSIGGTAGLFFGASLLSIIETLYLLIIRK